MDNEPRILHPGDPEAQTLARAIASPTAGEILQVLGEEPLTASALATRLEIPITTAAYHLEHLVGAGVIEVTGMRWSRKGREQKVYRLVDRLVIVSPARMDLRSLLLKYAALGFVLGGAALIAGLLQAWTAPPGAFMTGSEGGNGLLGAPLPVPADMAAATPEPVARYILLGGLVVLAALVIYDAIATRRRRP
ncbi:MAG: helix-turn-helix domain-containing protein [Methanospirillum sp.]